MRDVDITALAQATEALKFLPTRNDFGFYSDVGIRNSPLEN
tara:strand:+ start:1973 stop:2095 length:123 start_codon:yes stop_codon:yes gene_type:complete